MRASAPVPQLCLFGTCVNPVWPACFGSSRERAGSCVGRPVQIWVSDSDRLSVLFSQLFVFVSYGMAGMLIKQAVL
jgi:hypothetical protein